MNRAKRGLTIVLTGDGKGKTTAALGMAFRAIGHGMPVYMLQFMKGSGQYGELKAAPRCAPLLTIVQSGRKSFVCRDNPDPEDIMLACKGLELAKEAIRGGRYDLVILDEINVALDFHLIPLEEVLAMLQSKPAALDLVLTGRGAPPEILELADTVSEIREIKHHYRQRLTARKGIEF